MTLTTVLPSLRRSIPDPIERRAWPEHTVAEVRDVTVAGVSLTRLAELEGTPCVMTGDLAHPHTQDARRRGIGMDVTVLVFRVTLRVDSQDARRLALVDCTTHDLPTQWEHCRLIGRASTAKQAMFSPSALDVAHRIQQQADELDHAEQDLVRGRITREEFHLVWLHAYEATASRRREL